MKKRISLFIATVLTIAALPAAAMAAPTTPVTDVTGTVTHNGNLVQGAGVSVTCNGNTGTDTTDSTGTYLVEFSAAQCPKGDTAVVTASKGGLSGNNSGPAGFITNKLNIALVNVSVVPEFGALAGAGAAILGGAAFMVIRRKQLGQN